MVSPGLIFTVLNSVLGMSNHLRNQKQQVEISDIRTNITKREQLLSKDIQHLIDQQMGSGASNEMDSRLRELIALKGDLINLIDYNKKVEQADLIVDSINSAIDPFIASILTQLSHHGLAISSVLDSNLRLVDIVGSLTQDQEVKWYEFVTTVQSVVSNLELKISDLERLISMNKNFQAELSFQMLALKAETNGKLLDLQNYIKYKEDELAIQLRVLGSLQDNATVVLTEKGELVYSNSVTNKSNSMVVAGTLTQQTVDGFQGARVTGINVRQADLIGDGNSFSTNEDTFINLNLDYNGEVLYLAVRTNGNGVLDLLNLSTITTIRNVTHIIDTPSYNGFGNDWRAVISRNVTTALRDPSDPYNFHFGLQDGIGLLPQLVNVEMLKGSPGLSILKLSVDPGVRANFSQYVNKTKTLTRYGNYVDYSIRLLNGEPMGSMNGLDNLQYQIGGTYRKVSQLVDFNSSLYKARLVIKIPKSNIGIDGITVFKI